MANFLHVFVLFSLVLAESAVFTGKALYCRDPDTGKLHAVDTTWVSTTFCGNYTCKLKKRNITETEYTPIRQLNITNMDVINETNIPSINSDNTNSVHDNDTKDSITITIEPRTEPEIQSVIHKNKASEVAELMNNISNKKDDSNRYLTEKEIKSIAEILHTVKKSDLDAIVDIYNLAQDIYNEMDKATNEGIIDDTINAIEDEKYRKNPKKSYWYDPLTNKGRVDMDYQGSNLAPSTVQPRRDVPSYFNGALSSQDFGKLPYYYPLSSFQRSSTYVHQPTQPSIERSKPCKARERLNYDTQGSQHLIQPSYLLPYPFTYIHHYNYSDYNNAYYKNNPYIWDYYNRQRQYQPYYNPYIVQDPNAILTNSELHDEVTKVEEKPIVLEDKDLLGKILLKTKENVIPDWKTEQLSSKILDEVRANIDTSKLLKAYPLRKKVKLEKVGKLIKLDELTRSVRSTDDEGERIDQDEEKEEELIGKEGEYETYLERTTCQTLTIPGYFRYGNLSQPYPECCPQLINK